MYVKGPDNAYLNLNTATSSRLRGGWQVGQLLKAMVVEVGPGGGARLEINGQQVQAQPQANLPLRPGQMLQLEVTRGGEQPVLKVLNPATTSAEVITRGVRESLPQQQPLKQILNGLLKLAEGGKGDVGGELRALSRQIIEQLPQLQQLQTGSALKKAVEDSGTFLEAKLRQALDNKGDTAQTQNQLSRDLKAGLLRLLQTLRALPQANTNAVRTATTSPTSATPTPTPTASAQPAAGATPAPTAQTAPQGPLPAENRGAAPTQQPGDPSTRLPQQDLGRAVDLTSTRGHATEIPGTLSLPAQEARQHVESGLARIQYNQLQGVQQTESQNRPNWLVDIPIRQADGRVDTLRMEVQRDREGDGSSQNSIWSVSLSFQLRELGAIRAGLTLVGERQIGVSLWADESKTVELFNQHLVTLQTQMQEAGLLLSRAHCQQGIPRTAPPERAFSGTQLVDVKA